MHAQQAYARLKFSFTSSLIDFWELQGMPLTRNPTIAGSPSDLFKLFKVDKNTCFAS